MLECSFQVESVPESGHSQSEIRWLWHGRSISNNSEGVLSSQRFTIHEFDYFLTGPTGQPTSTSTFDRSTPSLPTTIHSEHVSGALSSFDAVKTTNESIGSSSNRDDFNARDFEPIRELDSNESKTSERQTIQATESSSESVDLNRMEQPVSSSTIPSRAPAKSVEMDSVEPFGSYQVLRRRMRKSRLEITFMLELNQGMYTCEASNAAGHSSANFSVKVGPAKHDVSSSSSSSSQSLTKHSRQQAEQLPSVDASDNKKAYDMAAFPTANVVKSRSHDGATVEADMGEELLPTSNVGDTPPSVPDANSANDRLINTNNSIFFGLLLGILFGILLVLLVFSLLIIFLCRKKDSVDDIPSAVITRPASVGGSCVDLGVHLALPNAVSGTLCPNSNLIHQITTLPPCAGDLHALDSGHLISQYGYLTGNSQYLTSEPIYKSLGSIRIESVLNEKY